MSRKRKVALILILALMCLNLCGCLTFLSALFSGYTGEFSYAHDNSAEYIYRGFDSDYENYNYKKNFKNYMNAPDNINKYYDSEYIYVFQGFKESDSGRHYLNMYNPATGQKYSAYDIQDPATGFVKKFKKKDEYHSSYEYYNAEYDVTSENNWDYGFYTDKCVTFLTDNTATVIIQMIDMKPACVWLNARYEHCNTFLEESGLKGFYLNIDGKRIPLNTTDHLKEQESSRWSESQGKYIYTNHNIMKEVPVSLHILDEMINADSIFIEVLNAAGDSMEVRDLRETSDAILNFLRIWRLYEAEYRGLINHFETQGMSSYLKKSLISAFKNHGIRFTDYDSSMEIQGNMISWSPFASDNNPTISNGLLFSINKMVILKSGDCIYPLTPDPSGRTPLPLDLIDKLISNDHMIRYEDEEHYISGNGTEFKLSNNDKLILELAQEVSR